MKLREFYHALLRVDPKRALEPRHETELLVEKIVFSSKHHPPTKILDLCCGSGTIGIPLKIAFPNAALVCSDLSPLALSLLRENLELNRVEATVLEGDLLTPVVAEKHMFDLFVCNPPYVPLHEVDLLDQAALEEPSIALFGGEDGLDFYRRLSSVLPQILLPKAHLYFEIGYNQGERVMEQFQAPHYTKLCVEKDYAGHDRFFSLVFEPQSVLKSCSVCFKD